MKNFNHKNIISLIGVCIDNDGSTMVIMQYMKNGDLLSYIRKNDVDNNQLLKFALDVAHSKIIIY